MGHDGALVGTTPSDRQTLSLSWPGARRALADPGRVPRPKAAGPRSPAPRRSSRSWLRSQSASVSAGIARPDRAGGRPHLLSGVRLRLRTGSGPKRTAPIRTARWVIAPPEGMPSERATGVSGPPEGTAKVEPLPRASARRGDQTPRFLEVGRPGLLGWRSLGGDHAGDRSRLARPSEPSVGRALLQRFRPQVAGRGP